MTRGLQLTTLISLLQPSPEVVALFDDIMLMADGEAWLCALCGVRRLHRTRVHCRLQHALAATSRHGPDLLPYSPAPAARHLACPLQQAPSCTTAP